ncbi:MAG: hypothetical protein Q8M73_05175 [Actinomycetota bacterium]|nr:hypothetical protein [Actinomycetota bacterium]
MLRYDPFTLFQTVRSKWEHLRAGLASTAVALARGHLNFYADTSELAAAYSELISRPVDVLPVPVDSRAGSRSKRAIRERNLPGANALISYMGDARREKGFHLLPQIVRQINAAEPSAKFWIQVYLNVEGGEPQIVDTVKELESFPSSLVHLQRRPLSERSFLRQLKRSSLILLPYSATAYRRRSSAILVEAMVAGTPVVAVGGTWMARTIQKFGSGESASSESEFANCAVASLGSARQVLENLQRHRSEISEFSSAARLVALLTCARRLEPEIQKELCGEKSLVSAAGEFRIPSYSTCVVQILLRTLEIDSLSLELNGAKLLPTRGESVGGLSTLTFRVGASVTDSAWRSLQLGLTPAELVEISSLRVEIRIHLGAKVLSEFTDAQAVLHPPETGDGFEFAWTKRANAIFDLPRMVSGLSSVEIVTLATRNAVPAVAKLEVIDALTGLSSVVARPTASGHGRTVLPVESTPKPTDAIRLELQADDFGQASHSDERQVGVALESLTVTSRAALRWNGHGWDEMHLGDEL